MKTNILIISILVLFTVLSCSLNKNFEKHLQNRVNNNKMDTIYILKNNDKYITKKKYINNKILNYYQIEYKFTFKKSNKYLNFISLSHRRSQGKLIEMPPTEKNKKFRKKIKHKTFTFDDFKNKTTYEINRFYHFNNFKTFYLIDKDENKNGKIYLRKVSFGGNFPRIQ